MYHPVITVFACVYQAKKYAYPPDVTKHSESISNPHTCNLFDIDIGMRV